MDLGEIGVTTVIMGSVASLVTTGLLTKGRISMRPGNEAIDSIVLAAVVLTPIVLGSFMFGGAIQTYGETKAEQSALRTPAVAGAALSVIVVPVFLANAWSLRALPALGPLQMFYVWTAVVLLGITALCGSWIWLLTLRAKPEA
jgi:hypothetical protein